MHLASVIITENLLGNPTVKKYLTISNQLSYSKRNIRNEYLLGNEACLVNKINLNIHFNKIRIFPTLGKPRHCSLFEPGEFLHSKRGRLFRVIML